MASPLVRRQISLPPLFSTSTSRVASPMTTPTSTATGSGLFPPVMSIINGVSSLMNAMSSSGSSPSQSTSSSQSTPSLEPTPTPSSVTNTPSPSTVSSVSTPTPPLLTPGATTITETTSDTAPPSSGTSEPKGKSFLENKPLAGFVFGLAGLAALIIVIIAVTTFARRRNRKRLLADASNFSFDPKHIEDKMSDEKHPGLAGHSGDGAAGGFAGVGMGSISRRRPSLPSLTPAYTPQDYAGHDDGYPAQHHNLRNVPVGYNSAPNPYDLYGPRNSVGHPNSQGQYDPFNLSGSSDNRLSMTDSGPPVPYQLRPGVHPTQGPSFTPILSTSPAPLNHLPPIPSTASPPPDSLQRLPTPDAPPDAVGRRNSVDDDAYGGASFGRDSPPPAPRTLQVANM